MLGVLKCVTQRVCKSIAAIHCSYWTSFINICFSERHWKILRSQNNALNVDGDVRDSISLTFVVICVFCNNVYCVLLNISYSISELSEDMYGHQDKSKMFRFWIKKTDLNIYTPVLLEVFKFVQKHFTLSSRQMTWASCFFNLLTGSVQWLYPWPVLLYSKWTQAEVGQRPYLGRRWMRRCPHTRGGNALNTAANESPG